MYFTIRYNSSNVMLTYQFNVLTVPLPTSPDCVCQPVLYTYLQGQLPDVSVTLPLVIIGILTLIAAVVSLWLPETLLSNMSETVADIESSSESYGVIWMEKPRPCPFSLPCGR